MTRSVAAFLEVDEMAVPTAVGRQRHEECVRRGIPERGGRGRSHVIPVGDPEGRLQPGEDHLEKCISSALAECAVAKKTGLPWTGCRSLTERYDVEPLQVRSTHHADGHLLLHERLDWPEDAFVLVTGYAPYLFVEGWCIGREVMCGKYLQDRLGTNRWAFWVPQEVLRPYGTLMPYVRRLLVERGAA